MNDEEVSSLTTVLMNGAPAEQEEAARRLDEWFVKDQKRNILKED